MDYESSRSLMTIYTPSGECPIRLQGTDAVSVLNWVDAVREYGYRVGKQYTISALCYWVRQFYEMDTVEHRKACDHVMDDM